jgi:phosphoserine phosphatase
MEKEPEASSVPLCVDLDGTIIRTDLGVESFFRELRRAPLAAAGLLARAPFQGGRSWLKRELAKRVSIAPESLPYADDVLSWCREEAGAGRVLVLATGSDEIYARQVALHLGIFREALGSDGRVNLVGRAKARALVGRFGRGGFDYAGDARADLPVWGACRRAIAAGGGAGHLLRKRLPQATIERIFERPGENRSTFMAAVIRAVAGFHIRA